MIHLVLLSGGSGTRLWPLSNNSRSKQFLKVLRDEHGNHISMVQRVFNQISRVDASTDITIATIATQEFSIESQVESGYELVLEPERRDTAPAIMLACAHLVHDQHASADDTVIVMPIDTYADQEYYDQIVSIDACVQAGVSDLTLLGVKPTFPSQKYGYIVPEAGVQAKSATGAQPVSRFVEKPDEATAIKLLEQGALWNCGVFAFKLGYVTAITNRYYEAKSFADLRENYVQLPKNSFDYEVVEKAKSIAVVPYAGMWKDLGTWNTLTEEMADAGSGRVIGLSGTCDNTHVINELGLPLVTLGLKDMVVVATHDGILISDKEASSSMKPFVNRVAEERPMYEQRRWGQYRVLDSNVFADGTRELTKELTIRAGKQLSYQVHKRRSEIWTIVSGKGEVVLNGEVQPVEKGSVIKVYRGMKHACRAFEDIRIVEVQLGDLLEEYDIERYGDYWDDLS